jgi:hypothetical protein
MSVLPYGTNLSHKNNFRWINIRGSSKNRFKNFNYIKYYAFNWKLFSEICIVIKIFRRFFLGMKFFRKNVAEKIYTHISLLHICFTKACRSKINKKFKLYLNTLQMAIKLLMCVLHVGWLGLQTHTITHYFFFSWVNFLGENISLLPSIYLVSLVRNFRKQFFLRK